MSISKNKRELLATIAALILVIPMMAATPLPASAEMPKVLTITCYPIGSAAAILATAFSETIEKKTGVRCRPTPADQDMARLLPIKNGEAQAGILSAGSVYAASTGKEEFAREMWGPQPLRYVLGGSAVIIGVAVRADSGIKTWNDLKGKRVCIAPGALAAAMNALLAYGGLKTDEVKVVQATGYTHAIKSVMSGGGDACILSPTSPVANEWDAAPYGLRFLPMSDSDAEGWKRVVQHSPLAPYWTTYGAPGEGGAKWLAYYPYVLVTYPNASEEVVYTMAKALVEGRNLYKDVKKPESEQWTMEASLDLKKPVYIPYHPGFIKLAKEIGLWTAQHDDFQAEALKAESQRVKK